MNHALFCPEQNKAEHLLLLLRLTKHVKIIKWRTCLRITFHKYRSCIRLISSFVVLLNAFSKLLKYEAPICGVVRHATQWHVCSVCMVRFDVRDLNELILYVRPCYIEKLAERPDVGRAWGNYSSYMLASLTPDFVEVVRITTLVFVVEWPTRLNILTSRSFATY